MFHRYICQCISRFSVGIAYGVSCFDSSLGWLWLHFCTSHCHAEAAGILLREMRALLKSNKWGMETCQSLFETLQWQMET